MLQGLAFANALTGVLGSQRPGADVLRLSIYGAPEEL